MNERSRLVFVSGYYDLIHAGHLQFLREARALGDRLAVCFASARLLWRDKQRRSALPDEHKRVLFQSLRMVDEVHIGDGDKPGLDFEDHFLRLRPAILAVTGDDRYADLKRGLCRAVGAEYVVLPKTPPSCAPISASDLVKQIQSPDRVPLRVDFAGGWLDVPRLARPDGFVVNCSVTPMVSLREWPYRSSRGLGGSAAWALLNGQLAASPELALGTGWQDAAVIRETGLCVWRSGPRPVLDLKRSGEFLRGRLLLTWTGPHQSAPALVERDRDYAAIARAGALARQAVLQDSLGLLAEAMTTGHGVQVAEGMPALRPAPGALAVKYCGGGWGGYALHLFPDGATRDAAVASSADSVAVEPFLDTRSGESR